MESTPGPLSHVPPLIELLSVLPGALGAGATSHCPGGCVPAKEA